MIDSTFKLEGMDEALNLLHRLPKELVSTRGGPVRKALRKGAMVLVKQARSNLQHAIDSPGKSGITNSTGATAKNVIARYKAPLGGVNGERYLVTVRYDFHPSGNKFRKSKIRFNDIAFMMEYGTPQQPAIPWLVPAFHSKKQEAVAVATQDLARQIDAIVKKLSWKV